MGRAWNTYVCVRSSGVDRHGPCKCSRSPGCRVQCNRPQTHNLIIQATQERYASIHSIPCLSGDDRRLQPSLT